MKFILLLLTAFILQSCSASEQVLSETDALPEESYTSEFLESLQFEDMAGGVMASSLVYLGDVVNQGQVEKRFDYVSVYTASDGYTHITREYPHDAVDEVKVYDGQDYSEPVRVIELEGMDSKVQICYGLSWNSNTMTYDVLVTEKTGEEYPVILYRFDAEGNNIARYEVPINFAEPVVCNNGMLYAVKNNGIIGGFGQMVRVDPKTGNTYPIEKDVYNCCNVDGYVYYVKRNVKEDYTVTNILCALDTKNNHSEEIMEFTAGSEIASIAYDSKNEVVYYTDATQSSVLAYDTVEKKVVRTAKVDVKLVGINDTSLLIEMDNGVISSYELTSTPEEINNEQLVLKICCIHDDEEKFSRLYETVLENMSAAGIPVELEVTYMSLDESEYQNTIAKKLLAGDSDFDLIELTPGMTSLMEGKYYADLSQYKILQEYIDAYIPGLRELCTVDSKTAFAPRNPVVQSMAVNGKLIPDGFSVPKTFDEIFEDFDLAEDVYVFGDTSEKSIIRTWFEELASNYMTETIAYDTALADLERLFTVIRDIESYEDIDVGEDYRAKNSVLRILYNNGRPSQKSDTYFVALPKLSEEYKHSVWGTFLAVNENAANKEGAIAFLAYYFWGCMNTTSDFRMLFFEGGYDRMYPDASETDNKYDVFKAQIADSIRMVEVEGFVPMVFSKWGLIDCVVNNEITPEEAAEEAMRYLKMVRDE